MRILLFALLILASCQKEVNNNTTTQSQSGCECGVIVQEDTYQELYQGTMSTYYKYKVKNDCSNNVSDWWLSQEPYTLGHSNIGNNYCLDESW